MFFRELTYNVVYSLYPCDLEDAVAMAAVHLQMAVGANAKEEDVEYVKKQRAILFFSALLLLSSRLSPFTALPAKLKAAFNQSTSHTSAPITRGKRRCDVKNAARRRVLLPTSSTPTSFLSTLGYCQTQVLEARAKLNIPMDDTDALVQRYLKVRWNRRLTLSAPAGNRPLSSPQQHHSAGPQLGPLRQHLFLWQR